MNVSTSRLILLNGNTGTSAAGHVIEAFGSFVVGGSYIIGAVIFCVLIAIQYVVINHGAVRISEVTARFTLDALPGKQMSIDADLNGGLIDEARVPRAAEESSAARLSFMEPWMALLVLLSGMPSRASSSPASTSWPAS